MRRSRATLAVGIAAVLLLVGAHGIVKYSPSLRLGARETKTADFIPRPIVAVLGLRDDVNSPRLKWLPTAVTELLANEVAAAESSVRILGTHTVDLERRSLGLSQDEVGEEKAQARLQALLDADVLVHGTLAPQGAGSDDVHLRIRVLDAHSRKELGVLNEDLGPGAARLVEALPALGTGLRSLLNVRMTSEEENALSSSRAHTLDAVKLHAEGVIRFRRGDIDDARSHFEGAFASDPSFFLPNREFISTCGAQSNRTKYFEGLHRLRALRGITARQVAMIDAALLREQDEVKTTDAFKTLFEAYPDEFLVGNAVLGRSAPRAKLAVIKRMQQMRAAPPLMLALREDWLWRLDDAQRSKEGFDHIAARALELGARWELGQARLFQAQLVSDQEAQRRQEALDLFGEAERLTADVGALGDLADVKRQKALWLLGTGSRRDAFSAMDDAAGAYRRIGDLEQVAHLLLLTGDYLRDYGALSAARTKLEEARRELETIESQPDGIMFNYYFRSRAWQLFDTGDLDGAREALRRARRSATMPLWAGFVELLEARLLEEEDHREEARGAYAKARSEPAFRVAGACTIDCDGDQPTAGLECLSKACREDDPEFNGVLKASCQVEEAHCRFRAHDPAGAEKAARQAASFLDSKDYYELALRNRAILMRVAASRGESAKAIRALRADLATVESENNTRLSFETALVLGEVELRAGRREGRSRLEKLEQEAKAREFFRIARLAREALDQKPLASATPH